MPGKTNNQEWLLRELGSHEGRLTRYATRLTGDQEWARDLVQETFARLWKAGPEATRGFTAQWLFRVCRNLAFDLMKKEKRMIPADEQQLAMHAGATVPERPEPFSIAEALQQLPANQQEVIRLKFQEGMSYRDISQITGLSESNVGYLIHMGVKSLKTMVRDTASGPAKVRGGGQ